jgi:hypothetical protein
VHTAGFVRPTTFLSQVYHIEPGRYTKGPPFPAPCENCEGVDWNGFGVRDIVKIPVRTPQCRQTATMAAMRMMAAMAASEPCLLGSANGTVVAPCVLGTPRALRYTQSDACTFDRTSCLLASTSWDSVVSAGHL